MANRTNRKRRPAAAGSRAANPTRRTVTLRNEPPESYRARETKSERLMATAPFVAAATGGNNERTGGARPLWARSAAAKAPSGAGGTAASRMIRTAMRATVRVGRTGERRPFGGLHRDQAPAAPSATRHPAERSSGRRILG